MRRLISAGAVAATVLAFVLLLAIGLFLAGFEQTGAQGTGVLLLACAAVAFGAFLFLARAPLGYFAARRRRPLGLMVSFVAAAPVVALAWAALVFTGLPMGTSLPMMDWPLFVLGMILGLGGLCVLALGYRRLSERAPPAASAAEPRRTETYGEEEIRVRRV